MTNNLQMPQSFYTSQSQPVTGTGDIMSFMRGLWPEILKGRAMYGDQFMPMLNMAWQQTQQNRNFGLEQEQLAQQKARMAEEERQFNANYGLKERELNSDLFQRAVRQAGATYHPGNGQYTPYFTDRWGQLTSPYSFGGG